MIYSQIGLCLLDYSFQNFPKHSPINFFNMEYFSEIMLILFLQLVALFSKCNDLTVLLEYLSVLLEYVNLLVGFTASIYLAIYF